MKKEYGIFETLNYRILSIRNKFPLINRLIAEVYVRQGTAYGEYHIASFDDAGLLTYFNNAPNYPEDFKPIRHNTLG